jgi:tetratricopeptide (TPR) repeat protein
MIKKATYFPIFVVLLLSLFLFPLEKEKKVIPLTTKSEKALGYFHKAMHAYHQAYEKESLENFKLAAETDPEFVMALTWYSRYLSSPDNQRMIDEAKKHFSKASEGERAFTLAIEALLNNNLEQAVDLLEKLASEYPDDGMVHSELAAAYSLEKMDLKAIQEYEKAVACNLHNYSAYNSLGYACIRVGKFEEAIKWLEKYSELMPDSANPLDSLGDAYRNMGKYKKAWINYQKALKVKPDFTASILHLGDVKYELGFYQEALRRYKNALKSLLPEREISESHYKVVDSIWRPRLVNTYFHLNNLVDAEKEINTILQHNTNFGDMLGHYLAGELALLEGDTKKAKEEASLIQKYEMEYNFLSQEKDQIVNFMQAKIAMADGNLSQAEKFIGHAIDAFEREGQSYLLNRIYSLGSERQICVEPLNLLAELAKKRNRPEEEADAIKRSLGLIPHQPGLHYRLGQIYEQQKKMDQAGKEFKVFLELVKEFNGYKDEIRDAEKFVSNMALAQEGGEDLSRYLEETEHLDFNHPAFTDTLAKVVTENMSREKKLKRLYYFTRDIITFVPSASLTASGALKEKKAICYTKAMIYVSLCRRLGVPANVAMVEFIIKAKPEKTISGHGIAKVFVNGKWIYIDTVSNKEAWSYWDKKNASSFETPVFSLEHNVLVDERFVSDLALKDFETNDVPQKWLKSLQNFLDTGKY